tara:strand:+ start:70 stop:1128 length:1059 start_codon:yes stop_codon:yes gene_type:complete
MSENTGPKVFLSRLFKKASIPKTVYLTNPDNNSISIAKEKKQEGLKIVGRLDGARPYKFTFMETLGFLGERYKFLKKIPQHRYESYEMSREFTKSVNKYLDRNSIWLHNNANAIIFQSSLSKKMHEFFLGYRSFQPNKIINNGVDLNEFKPNSYDVTKRFFPNVLVSASEYRPHKRLKDSIELINFLSKPFPNIRLHILGELNHFVKKEIELLNLDNCIFYGRLNQKSLPEVYRKQDFQLSLSMFDACPNVVAEGLASGLPVVTCEESGAFELINQNKSWSVNEEIKLDYYEYHRANWIPKANLSSYCEKIMSIIENLREEKQIARNIAEEKLSIDLVSKKYLQFIESQDED